jgi:hypothetical protein
VRNETIAATARAAAARLADQRAPRLVADVELELVKGPPAQYVDPVSIGGLVVAVATLAWQVYTDLKSKTAQPSPEVVARTVRVRIRESGDGGAVSPEERDRVIDVVVEETVEQDRRS